MRALFLFLFLVSCSSLHRQETEFFTNAFKNSDYEGASAYLEKSAIAKDDKSKILFHLQKGSILFESAQYKQSVEEFLEAQRLLDESIKSISLGAISYLASDGLKSYLGEYLEQGMINFYLVLNFLNLSELEVNRQQKRQYLFSARAQIIAWDLFFEKISQKNSQAAKFYPTDFLVKILGAFVHEKIESRNERLIAYDLYKDAYEALKEFGIILPSFNNSYKDCTRNKIKKKTKCDPIKTDLYKGLESFLEQKILVLSKDLRKKDFKNWQKKLKGKKILLKKSPQLSILIKSNLIPKKKPYRFYAPIINYYPNYHQLKSNNYIFGSFATNVLGLQSSGHHHYRGDGRYVLNDFAELSAAQSTSISFELPSIEDNKPRLFKALRLESEDGSSQMMTGTLIAPLGDLFNLNNDFRVKKLYPKLASKLVVKHAAAIITARSVYKKLGGQDGKGKGSGSLLARTSALLAYSGSVKLFEYIQRADTRYWSSLPQDIFLLEKESLKAGEYDIYAEFKDGSSRFIKKVKIDDAKRQFLTLTILD